ncbi:MAG TPA: isoprenylcysteine carboxylmethyltransferase family protein [Candidatus Sulfotelmatobacter sp.]
MVEQQQAQWSRIARRIRVPLGFVFAIVYFWVARPQWISIALGMILILPGLLIRAFASGHVRKNEALATSGPYAYTRNPLYLGSLLIGLGFAVASRSCWIVLLLVVMLFAIYAPVILDEEKFLRQRFPEFDNYAHQVPRMFPKLLRHQRRHSDASSRFSAELYMQHREYNAAFGAALMLAALVVKMIWLHSST